MTKAERAFFVKGLEAARRIAISSAVFWTRHERIDERDGAKDVAHQIGRRIKSERAKGGKGE